MVDDLQNLRLLQTGDRLVQLVVIHQHHALSLGAQQVEARERANHAVVFIQNGIAAEAGFQRQLAYVVEIVGQMKRDEIFPAADARNRHREDDKPGRGIGVKRRGDDRAALIGCNELLGNLAFADDDRGCLLLQRVTDHVRLVAAEHHAVLADLGQSRVRRQRDNQRAGDHGLIRLCADEAAVETREQVEERDALDPAVFDEAHVVCRNLLRREHAVELAVLVGHR